MTTSATDLDFGAPGTGPLVEQWKAKQREMREHLVVAPLRPLPRFVAGADMAYSGDKKTAYAAAVVYDREERRILEIAHAVRAVDAPYVPGFLSFREGPAIVEAVRKLKHPFGAICFDGQGYAHPRRCGLASHVSIVLGVPGVGVAKSRLLGTFDDPAPEAGVVVAAGRPRRADRAGAAHRANTRPLFISIGHRVDLPSAAELVTRLLHEVPRARADAAGGHRSRQTQTVSGLKLTKGPR